MRFRRSRLFEPVSQGRTFVAGATGRPSIFAVSECPGGGPGSLGNDSLVNMATPSTLDFEALLAPISPELPTGQFWRTDSAVGEIYLAIKGDVDESRKIDRQLLVPQLPDEKVPVPRWNQVAAGAIEALSSSTKDLWIAAWLIEGLSRKKGKEFAGMRDGFRLVRELCERYWGELHPPADEDALAEGILTTVVQLAGLNGVESDGTLVMAIRRIELTFDRNQLEDVEECLDEFQRMTEALDQRCGTSPDGMPLAPPSTQLRAVLEACRDKLREALGSETSSDGTEAESGEQVAPDGASSSGKSEKLSRDSAFNDLLRIADFFQRTEPHSPVSYALRQAVQWGRMSLPELLTELIPSSEARDALFKRAGIPEPPVRDE